MVTSRVAVQDKGKKGLAWGQKSLSITLSSATYSLYDFGLWLVFSEPQVCHLYNEDDRHIHSPPLVFCVVLDYRT